MNLFTYIFEKLSNSPEASGRRGENKIYTELCTFSKYHEKLIKNIYIPTKDDETTEIDLLYLTTKGIFVIESKNYSGYIFGHEKNKTWVSTLYAGKTPLGQKKVEKNYFYNPIWQNKTHIKYLKEYLDLHKIPIFSLIVFSDHCEFKEVTVISPNTHVCHRSGIRQCIKNILEITHSCMTEADIKKIYSSLLPLTTKDEAFKKKHIDNIEKKYSCTKICPWCGGQLVLRTARNGKYAGNQFYGCSNYPKCKYIMNIDRP